MHAFWNIELRRLLITPHPSFAFHPRVFIFLGRRGEREREIYIFPWLQVRITGPRHHLTSSLRSYAQGYDNTRRYLQYVFEYIQHTIKETILQVQVYPEIRPALHHTSGFGSEITIVRGVAVRVAEVVPLHLQQLDISIGHSGHNLFYPFGYAPAWQMYGALPTNPKLRHYLHGCPNRDHHFQAILSDRELFPPFVEMLVSNHLTEEVMSIFI